MNNQITILVIEDDPVITEFLKTGLKYEGYVVSASKTGKGGIEMVHQGIYSLLILDIMLPDINGFEVCKHIRNAGFNIPILMLTVKKEVSDRIKGLNIGADDYLTKPFSFDELLARIRALLRRSGKILENKKIQAGKILVNTETREVFLSGNPVNLTPTEFSLLELFMQHPRRVFTRETLLNRVLGYEYNGGTNIIDVHISHLRRKLDDKATRMIKTIYGIGYAFYP